MSACSLASCTGANVLVNEQGVSKLADFGCSKQLPQIQTTSLEESLRSIRGSIPWMAPEVVKQTGHGFKADIWSIGATVIEMATARHPWPSATNSLSAMYAIATATSSPPLPTHLSEDAISFLQRCFCIDPEGTLASMTPSHDPSPINPRTCCSCITHDELAVDSELLLGGGSK